MLLTKHRTPNGSRWAVDGHFLPPSMNLTTLLEMTCGTMFEILEKLSGNESASGEDEAPIDPQQEVWAAGVTYLQSREARKAESSVAAMYQKIYQAERPEIFLNPWGGAFRATADQSASAGIVVGMYPNRNWCWSLIVAERSWAIVQGTTSPRAISKGKTRSTCHRRRSITARAYWVMVFCCANPG